MRIALILVPQFGQNLGMHSQKSSNNGSSLSSEAVMSSSTRPAQPQTEHQMPSTGLTLTAFEKALCSLILLVPFHGIYRACFGFLSHRGYQLLGRDAQTVRNAKEGCKAR